MPSPRRRPPVVASLVSLIAWLSAGPSPAEEPFRVRVLSYNINHGEGADSRVNLGRITDAIKAAEPDVVALQEVDRGVVRTGRIDQARLLAGRLGMDHAFGGNLEIFGGEFGNAVLSRYPIEGRENHRLPSPSGGEPRGALEVTIAPQGGPAFRLISTQLDHRRDDRDRVAAAARLAELAESPGGPPAILAGDLNAPPPDDSGGQPGSLWSALGEAWTPLHERVLPTVPADAPRVQFDHLAVTPGGRWRVIEIRTLDESAASDHRPILAVLELVPGRVGPEAAP